MLFTFSSSSVVEIPNVVMIVVGMVDVVEVIVEVVVEVIVDVETGLLLHLLKLYNTCLRFSIPKFHGENEDVCWW